MKEIIKLLQKHNLEFKKEFFYLLLHCIDDKIDSYENLVSIYKDRDNYEELKKDYKKFYDYMFDYCDSIDIDKEMMFHYKIIDIIDVILEDKKNLNNELQVLISNIIDLIFIKYNLDISKFNTNEEIKAYLIEKIKDEKIVDALILLLLADTTLSNRYIDKIPEPDFETILRTIISIAIYIYKGKK